MCGIAGVMYWDGRSVDEPLLERMGRTIRHRGPDDAGTFVAGGVGLAHQRLSILDTSRAAHQPMTTPERDALVYNGEVYNFRELRAELEAKGCRFRSSGDTEAVLHAARAWGVDHAVRRFNGIFAFAYWDARTQCLWLVRDRYGVKPLYYTVFPGGMAFASEIKALLTLPDVSRRVNKAALVEYFTFQNLYSDTTLFEGVHLLPPGRHMAVSASGGVQSISSYWDFTDGLAGEPLAADACVDELRDVFERSVKRQLVSDVPVGSYLSGGVDSGALVSVAAQALPRLMTFTGGFDLSSVTGLELTFDEREFAEATASAARTEHYEMVMHAGDMAHALPDVVRHLEDLRAGMCYQNYYIARLAGQFVKVVLSGVGGDELFAGYPWRYDRILAAPTRDVMDTDTAAYWQRLVPAAQHRRFFTDGVLGSAPAFDPVGRIRDVLAPYDALNGRTAREGWQLSRALYFEAKTFLHGLLVVEDKMSIAHSLESRVPFLDNELVDLALRIPASMKLRQTRPDPVPVGEGQGMYVSELLRSEPYRVATDGKYVLREAMAGLVPDSVRLREKRGFSPPDDSWYRGESMAYVKDILLDPLTLGRGYIQPSAIRRVVSEHTEGRVNHRLLIWSLLSFEWWCRVFLDQSGIDGA